MGISSVQFKVWLDARERPLKVVLTEAGSNANVTVTEVNGIGQPANVQFPLASETYVVPETS